jgi:hypothetical protein
MVIVVQQEGRRRRRAHQRMMGDTFMMMDVLSAVNVSKKWMDGMMIVLRKNFVVAAARRYVVFV